MGPQHDGMAIARARIAEEAERRTGALDLSGLGLETLPEELFSLRHLRRLDLGSREPWKTATRNRVDALRERLDTLGSLQALSLAGSDLSSLEPFRALKELGELDCSDTQVADLAPLAQLTSFQQLDCSRTQVADLAPLAGLTSLQQLDCSGTQVADLAPLAGLASLQQLGCADTQVADLAPLAGLVGLQQLDCSYTQVDDLAPLARLTSLRQLFCSSTQVADLAPLAGLVGLQQLDCSYTQVDDLAPLARIASLRQLFCSSTQVADLSPLAGLTSLQQLDCSGCRLKALPGAIRDKPSLHELVLFESHVPCVPSGVLSQNHLQNCLPAIRAHFADLAMDAAVLPDVRLLLLGNGRVGKTQIARWLAGETFNGHWDSTHGIEVRGTPMPEGGVTRLQIWDFGGQDIYHGTHTLFLRSPAVLMVVWAEDEEKLEQYEHGGLTFRNHPLAYWVDMVRHLADRASPVLIVQNKCNRPEQEVLPFPVSDEALRALPFRKQLHVSAREPRRGQAALMEDLGEAIGWLRDPERLGLPQIGAGRLRVQRRLEALRDEDMKLPAGERRHRLLERHEYEAICAEEGGVSDTGLLLAYLDASGTVFHRPGLFGDRIVLDQGWALEAIYAVFQREKVYRHLRWAGGRLTRSLLGDLVWQDKSEDEQKVLLGMMQSCGICFWHRELPDGEVEYVAPDLLPERAGITARLLPLWDEDQASEEAVFRHDLLHGGLIRTIMAAIGEMAGPEPLYWRGGLCGYETTTRSRLLIEEEMTGPWQGAIRVRTQGGQAAMLLERAVKVVEQAQARLGMRPVEVTRPSRAVELGQEVRMTFGQEQPAGPRWYVSYAWGDDRTPEGRQREEIVDRLCAEAEARGQPILRDKAVMRLGDSISEFMRRIGEGDRVFVFLSDKYLRSPHCMFELCEIWRTSRQEGPEFLARVRVYTLDDADIWEPLSRTRYAAYWRKKHDDLEAYVRENGGPSILGEKDFAAYRQMGEFYRHVGDILATLADIVQPRSFDELGRYGLD